LKEIDNVRFQAADSGFLLDGKPYFLYSGEIQYFRISRDLWRTHLEKLKAAGANTVSTYIPWSWHEVSEGKFDFTGTTDPQRDILGFMDLAKEIGLHMSVKPGPYILAEFEDAGIPEWLMKKHPEIKAQGPDCVTYMHPVFLDYTRKWYDAIMPHLAVRQISRDGNITLMQVCNEVGLFNWLGSTGDLSKYCIDCFQAFLKKQYKKIESLNAVYGSKYRSFESVPAPSVPTRSSGEYVQWNDWHDFHRYYYADYLSLLIGEIRKRGIDIQLFHNIPGWVYGRGTEYPINITFYAEIIRRHPELVLGVDHIPEFVTYRNSHDDLIINEMVKAMQGGKKPVWAAEQQAGTREHHVHTYPNEMELFYKACIGRGMTGMNFYMFSQGLNPHRRGAFGPTFYWMTALGHDASEKALYAPIAKIGKIVATFGQDLVRSQRRAGIHVAFYRPYYHDEFYYPLFGGVPKLDIAKAGLRYEPKAMRNTYYYDGLLRVLALQNRDFDMVDIQTTKPDPKKVKQLWVVSMETMDRETQETLAEYVELGGHLIIWPCLPDKDLKMRPCTILKKRLGIKEGAPARLTGVAKIDVLGLEDLNALSPVRTYSAPDGREIACTPDKQCIGVHRKVEKGRVTVLGAIFTYNIKEHLHAFEKLFDLQPVARNLKLSNPALQAHVRYGKDHAFLTLLNYTPVPQKVIAQVKDVPGLGDIQVPRQAMTMSPVSALIIPINYSLGKTTRILWSTAEILSASGQEGRVEISLVPSTLEEREIVLQLPASAKASVRLDGTAVTAERQDDRFFVRVPQGNQEIKLTVAW
jgi:beta-galactosidase